MRSGMGHMGRNCPEHELEVLAKTGSVQSFQLPRLLKPPCCVCPTAALRGSAGLAPAFVLEGSACSGQDLLHSSAGHICCPPYLGDPCLASVCPLRTCVEMWGEAGTLSLQVKCGLLLWATTLPSSREARARRKGTTYASIFLSI